MKLEATYGIGTTYGTVMKLEAREGTKDDSMPSYTLALTGLNPSPKLPTKLSFKGGRPPQRLKPINSC